MLPVPGSRVSERSSCGVPTVPEARSFLAAWKSSAYLRLKPTWKCTPAASTAARAASSSSSPSPAGFSQNTCFPARAAWPIRDEWKRPGSQ